MMLRSSRGYTGDFATILVMIFVCSKMLRSSLFKSVAVRVHTFHNSQKKNCMINRNKNEPCRYVRSRVFVYVHVHICLPSVVITCDKMKSFTFWGQLFKGGLTLALALVLLSLYMSVDLDVFETKSSIDVGRISEEIISSW